MGCGLRVDTPGTGRTHAGLGIGSAHTDPRLYLSVFRAGYALHFKSAFGPVFLNIPRRKGISQLPSLPPADSDTCFSRDAPPIATCAREMSVRVTLWHTESRCFTAAGQDPDPKQTRDRRCWARRSCWNVSGRLSGETEGLISAEMNTDTLVDTTGHRVLPLPADMGQQDERDTIASRPAGPPLAGV